MRLDHYNVISILCYYRLGGTHLKHNNCSHMNEPYIWRPKIIRLCNNDVRIITIIIIIIVVTVINIIIIRTRVNNIVFNRFSKIK